MKKYLTFVSIICQFMSSSAQKFSWQGHRGCRGLQPENTVASFLRALEYPEVTTLEMDVVITADGKVLVSHEAWMNHEICSKPDGKPVGKKEEKKFNLYQMNSEEIKQFDCGKNGHPRFPGQEPMASFKPLLSEVVDAIRNAPYRFPLLNIEIKTEGKRGDNLYHPKPELFVGIVLKEIERLSISDKVYLQSFDVRILREIKAARKDIPVALLVENMRGLAWNLKKLGFVPEIYSCHYKLLRQRTLEKCHNLKTKVIPWTVNNTEDMEKLIKMGVDGIITDYPNLISALATR